MKNKLLFRKTVTQLFLSLCLMLFCANTSWGQVQTLGSYPYMDGGFEGQSTGDLQSFVSTTSTTTWTRDPSSTLTSTNGYSKIINDATARTGNKYAKGIIDNTANAQKALISPNTNVAGAFPATPSTYIVQYYIRKSNSNKLDAAIGSGGNIAPVAPYVILTSNNTDWQKVCVLVTSSGQITTAVPAVIQTYVSPGRLKTTAGTPVVTYEMDDVVVYAGTTISDVDSTPPVAASGGGVSGTTVSWTAASGGVDGGGYMVVRYATNPNANNDPNQNGIYAVGNTITNGTGSLVGTVVYTGIDTSFTDAGSGGSTDYYKIYTVDKAFNYATEITATAVVSTTPTITSSIETLTGFNYTGVGPSTSQSFLVSGSNLTNDLVVSTTSTDFELSTDAAFSSPAGAATINLSGATVASTPIYVRLKSGLTGGLKTATVSIASTGATTLNISLSGSVQAVYYYNGSGLVSSNTSWGTISDGTGANPTAVTDTYANFVIANGNATTNASWTLGSNSKVIVGNGSAVSLTVADTFPIIGTIDAAANGSVVWQHVLASPTFGTLNNDSEVHFAPAVAASYIFGATTAYGKLFIDGLGVVSVSNTPSTPTVKTALTVASGSTLSFGSNQNPKISINSGATATINGKVITFRETGLFASTGSIPLNAAATLVLGANSTIEFGRPDSAQSITGLPAGVSYANLILSDGGSKLAAAKTIAAPFTVNGTLTINLATPAFSTISGASNITMANGSTVVMTSGVLGAIPSFAGGSKFNVTYNGTGKTQIVGATTLSSTTVTLASANAAIVAGMTVTGTPIPAGTTVASISGTTLELSAAATTTSTTPTLTFGTVIPQTTGVDLPTVANDALGNLTFDNPAGIVLSSAVKANNIITSKSNALTLNDANFLDANVQMNAGSELTLNVNANQANLKQIVFSGATGTTNATTAKLKLNMTVDTQVTFANSSAQNWGTGTVEITGFQEGKIKFGSSNSALTSTQLGSIKDTAYLTKTFKLSDQGYLYYSTTLVPGDAFVVTSENPVYLGEGAASTYVITTTNSPTSFVLADPTNDPLPAGLTLNATTGAIEGTPTVSVTNFVVAITISNSVNTTNTIDFTFNVVTRTAQAITWTDDLSGSRTYGDAAIALTATTDASALSVSYSSSNTAVATISGSTLTIVGPGTTTITASQAGNANYSPATNGTKELVVDVKALTIADAAATSRAYNKSNTADITGTLAGGLVGADVVTLVLSGTFADANVGTDKPVTSTSTLAGADAAKYSLTQPTGLIANITKADQLLAALGTSSFKILGDPDYDPIPLVTDPNVTLLPSVAVENPNFTYTSSNTSVATIVGGKVHIVGLGSTTIVGEQAGSTNYNASLPVTQVLKVLPAPLAAWDLYNFNPSAVQQSVTSVNASQVAAGISVTPSLLSMGNMVNVTNAGNRYRFTSSDWPYATSAGTLAAIDMTNTNGVANGKYMSVVIASNPGRSMSLSSINASFRGGAISNELLSQFAYSIDNGVTFTAIGSPTTFAGASGTRFYSDIDLSGIAALQNLPSGTTVTLRYYASGKSNVTTSNAGQKAWGFFSDFVENNTKALIIGGSVVKTPLLAPVVTPIVNVCLKATAPVLTATAYPGNTLRWYADNTTTKFTTTVPVLTTTAAGTKEFYVAQVDGTSVSDRAKITVNVLAAPDNVSTLTTSDAVLCKYIGNTNTVVYTAGYAVGTGSTTTSYAWTYPSTYTIIGSTTGSTLTVDFHSVTASGAVTLTPITVKGVNANQCSSLVAKSIALATKLPTAPTSLIMTSTDETAHFKGLVSAADPLTTPPTPAVYGLFGLNSLTAGIKKVGPYTGTETVFTMTAPAAVTAASYLWTLPTGVNAIASGTVAISALGVVTSTSPVITANFAGVTPGITALPIVVQSVAGCGNSTARTLSLARAIPTAPTALVLTNATQANLSSLLKITKVGPYTGTDIAFKLTATPFTIQGATSTSYAWILPTGVTCETASTPTTVLQKVQTGTTELGVAIFEMLPFDAVKTQTNEITVKFGNATKGVGNLDLKVFGVNGAGNSIARTLVLARALPTAPTALVLRDGATVVTKVGPYTAKETPLTLTATPFTIQGAEATSFSWVLPAGVNVTAGVDAALLITPPATVGTTKTWTGTSSVLTINLNGISGASTSMTSIPLSVYAVNGAGTSAAARTLTVTAAVPLPPTITGSTGTNYSSCATTTYTAPFQLGATYTWVLPNGATGTSTTNSIVADYSAMTAAIGASAAVTCSATNGTGTSTIKSLTVKRAACPPGKLSNSTSADFSAVAYPNPSTEGFKVTSSNKKSFGVQVYDMLGRSIEKRQMTSGAQIGSNYAKGIYNVIVTQDANVKTLRVIKQ